LKSQARERERQDGQKPDKPTQNRDFKQEFH